MNETKEITTMNQCYTCAYRNNIPGDCHSRCSFDFEKANLPMPKGDFHGIKNGWYMFPFNYDPVWMREICKGHSLAKDNDLVKQSNPIEDLLSIFAKRF